MKIAVILAPWAWLMASAFANGMDTAAVTTATTDNKYPLIALRGKKTYTLPYITPPSKRLVERDELYSPPPAPVCTGFCRSDEPPAPSYREDLVIISLPRSATRTPFLNPAPTPNPTVPLVPPVVTGNDGDRVRVSYAVSALIGLVILLG
ncbi:hypothetical protein CDD80_4162 [Ophiocordyceps camponoti-rufipedis]|uniref:Uncharacterized protein n=1 Tax=Ophiocordyceps camponoti-rufipedis TaxID=2004952 RepID=A0A2C5Y4C5_9HYPO|nr:hypothetical protein CDD80_4162 [Ophiocordyceps camponoti-rufipedis]